jgi:hypothetical protein
MKRKKEALELELAGRISRYFDRIVYPKNESFREIFFK